MTASSEKKENGNPPFFKHLFLFACLGRDVDVCPFVGHQINRNIPFAKGLEVRYLKH
jgi:hypothetical protein